MKNLDHKDVWVRAIKTFGQGFIAALGASDLTSVNLSSGKQLLLAAFAAGVAAVWNYVLQVASQPS